MYGTYVINRFKISLTNDGILSESFDSIFDSSIDHDVDIH